MITKIAFFLPNLSGGGAEKVSVNLMKEMVKYDNLQIDLVLGNAEGVFVNEVPKGVNVINLQSNRMINTVAPFARYLRSSNPDAVLAHISHTNVVALIAKLFSGTNVKVFIVEHNNLSARENRLLRSKLVRPLMRRLYPAAERVIGVSMGVSRNVREELDLDADKVVTIYNPVVMPEIFNRAKESSSHHWLNGGSVPVFLGVGRFTEQKDFINLLRAFALTLKTIDARLIILGDGPLRTELEEEIVELSIVDKVSLPGFCDNPYSYMSKAACFVLSSKYEGLPTVLIEAMACGCNVVSTNCPSGPNEILENGALGSLVPIEDHRSLASAMINSIISPLSSDALQSRALAFTPGVVVPQYVSLLVGSQ